MQLLNTIVEKGIFIPVNRSNRGNVAQLMMSMLNINIKFRLRALGETGSGGGVVLDMLSFAFFISRKNPSQHNRESIISTITNPSGIPNAL